MDSPIPPDPYEALGLTKDCKASDIKLAYRKLVLKWHPDKVSDEAQKAKAVEEFHKVQQAYELLSDEERRSRYDAQVRLLELKAERVRLAGGQGGIRVDTRSGPIYETRTAAPASAFPARGPTRAYTFDDRRPTYSSYSDEDLPRPSARRPTEYASVKRSPKEYRDRDGERDRERAREKEREREEKDRRDAERAREARLRERDRDYDRSAKTSRQREDAAYDDIRRSRETREVRPKMTREDTNEKMSAKLREAEEHISRGARPAAAARTASSREPQYAYVRRPTADSSRRSPPRESRDRPSRREAEVVEERRPPTLRKEYSEPISSMASEKPEVHRSYTTMTDSDSRRRTSMEEQPSLPRAQTMPTQHASTRSKPPQPSKLRESETAAGSQYSGSPTSGRRTVYTYDGAASGVKEYRTVTREPTSGASRPSVPPLDTRAGVNKTAAMMANLGINSAGPRTPLATPSRTSSYADYDRPPMRSSRSPERGSLRREEGERSRRLYGEISSSTPIGTPRSSRGNGGSYFPDVSYSARITPEDVKYAPGRPRPSRESSYADDGPRPTLSRSSTAVY